MGRGKGRTYTCVHTKMHIHLHAMESQAPLPSIIRVTLPLILKLPIPSQTPGSQVMPFVACREKIVEMEMTASTRREARIDPPGNGSGTKAKGQAREAITWWGAARPDVGY